MRIPIRFALLSCACAMLVACTQGYGPQLRLDQGGGATSWREAPAARTAPTGSSFAPASSPIEPAVPPVPDSPIKANCATLPTQVERDTCTNRKDSTG